jgi:hypothetical protein
VRFLVDENLSPRICPILSAGGHLATHVRDEGLAGANDHQVLAAAAAGGHILIRPIAATSVVSSQGFHSVAPAPARARLLIR